MQNEMTVENIREELLRNGKFFRAILEGTPAEKRRWKPRPESWSLLEIVCHLRDEEREDFRARIRHILEGTPGPLPPIDPEGWVSERNYAGQDFDTALREFLTERSRSVEWLEVLGEVDWSAHYVHPKFGKLSARLFLHNWLAHD
ncbi:MAG: DinB family protein, partial [Bacteroidetes bacterium]